jgi:methylglutaconyl-CoA hydratase
MTELIHQQVRAGVATITLDSPTNRNALSTALMEQLIAAIATADADPSVRVIVLSHTGPVFSSGADLKETATATAAGTMPAGRIGDVLEAIWNSPKPVLARIGGPARAGGLGIIAAADIAVCTREATFAFSEVRIGVIPAIISATVSRRLTPRGAAELYLTGDLFDGARAAEVGLVSRAVPADQLDAMIDKLTNSLVRGGPIALQATKKLLRRAQESTLHDELAAMTELSLTYFGSDEGREGVAAFREKREPAWIPAPTE